MIYKDTYRKTSAGELSAKCSYEYSPDEREFHISEEKIQYITSVYWSIGAVGYVSLFWDYGDKESFICTLSGNGNWELDKNRLIPNDLNAAKLKAKVTGFDSLDTFTIIFGGRSV